MRKLLYILPIILIIGFAACENYVDITPTGQKTVDSTQTYYELVALPNRTYHPMSFALLSDNVWAKARKGAPPYSSLSIWCLRSDTLSFSSR